MELTEMDKMVGELLTAVKQQQHTMMKLLIDRLQKLGGGDAANMGDEYGWTILHWAVFNMDFVALDLILELPLNFSAATTTKKVSLTKDKISLNVEENVTPLVLVLLMYEFYFDVRRCFRRNVCTVSGNFHMDKKDTEAQLWKLLNRVLELSGKELSKDVTAQIHVVLYRIITGMSCGYKDKLTPRVSCVKQFFAVFQLIISKFPHMANEPFEAVCENRVRGGNLFLPFPFDGRMHDPVYRWIWMCRALINHGNTRALTCKVVSVLLQHGADPKEERYSDRENLMNMMQKYCNCTINLPGFDYHMGSKERKIARRLYELAIAMLLSAGTTYYTYSNDFLKFLVCILLPGAKAFIQIPNPLNKVSKSLRKAILEGCCTQMAAGSLLETKPTTICRTFPSSFLSRDFIRTFLEGLEVKINDTLPVRKLAKQIFCLAKQPLSLSTLSAAIVRVNLQPNAWVGIHQLHVTPQLEAQITLNKDNLIKKALDEPFCEEYNYM